MEEPVILGGGYTCSVCGQYNRTSALCHHLMLIPKQENMNAIPTAEEWLLNHKELSMYDVQEHDEGGYLGVNEKALYKIMTEFAKAHVKAALEAAAENAMIDAEPESGRIVTRKEFDFDDRGMVCPYNLSINKQTILNAYPDDNIR